MRTLMPIVVLGMFLAFSSDAMSSYQVDELGVKRYIRKDYILYACMAVCMAVFVGLRTNGNDTYAYKSMYENIPSGQFSIISINWFRVADAPGLQAIMGLLHNFGASTQDYFMVMGLFTILVYLWFVRKYTCHIWLSIFYFITMGVYTFSMAAIKQTTAVAFLLIATDCAINKKWIRFIFWVAIAELFHPYSFIYLIIPFLFFKPWDRHTYVLMTVAGGASLALERLMGSVFTMTEALGYDNYSINEFSGEGVNIFRVAVVWVPVILSFLARKYVKNKNDRVYNLVVNAAMINAMIMFIGLFGTANYFARLANYFLIFQTIALPYLFLIFEERSKKIIIAISVIAYFIYFYYQNVLAQGMFDNTYSFITFIDFLKQL